MSLGLDREDIAYNTQYNETTIEQSGNHAGGCTQRLGI